LKLDGAGVIDGLGAKITVTYDEGKRQFHDLSVYRGYLSTVEDVVHFGLGSSDVVDEIEIIWLDGNVADTAECKCQSVAPLLGMRSRAKERIV
jgi:hypothetical protein